MELGTTVEDGEKWMIYGQAVKRMLKTLEPRCKLAGKIFYLFEICVLAITD